MLICVVVGSLSRYRFMLIYIDLCSCAILVDVLIIYEIEINLSLGSVDHNRDEEYAIH